MTAWSGRLFLGPGVFLYLGPGARADAHSHHAVQLVWSPEGTVRVERDGDAAAVRAALIPSGARHAFASSGMIALLLAEPHSPRGAALDRRARDETRVDLSRELHDVAFPPASASAGEAAAWVELLIQRVAGPFSSSPLSSLSRRAVDLIERAGAAAPSLTEVATQLRISPTRLTHVFTREVGIPFRRFVLWNRIKRAVEAVRGGLDLTAAAHHAGFSDGAHLSRTFREMFGLAPSAFLGAVEIIGAVWTAEGSP